jgi:hypothetical protein
MGLPSSIRQTTHESAECSVVNFAIQYLPQRFVHAKKSLPSVKIYYDLDGTMDEFHMSLGVGISAAMKEAGNVLAYFPCVARISA